MEPARTDYWMSKKYWSIYELVFLLRDLEPVPLEELSKNGRISIEADIQGLIDHITEDAPFEIQFADDPITHKVRSSSLLHWVSKVSHVKIPAKWNCLLPFSDLEKQTSDSSKAKLSTKEQKSYLLVIAALAREANMDISSTYKANSNGVISARLSEFGAELSENTIAKVLKEVNSLKEEF